MYGLTERELECLNLIKFCVENSDGVGPSYEELRRGLGSSSKSDIYRLVHSLEAKGWIKRLNYKARSIKVVQPTSTPPPMCSHCGHEI
jgi:SOS-response transcriptional repressor LexA